MKVVTSAVLAAALLAGCAAAPDTPERRAARETRQCFFASNVNGFQSVDRDTVRLTAGVNDVYELELGAGCLDVDWATRIGVRTRSGGSSICEGFDAELIVPSTLGGPQRCLVTKVRRVRPEELAAEKARSDAN